MGNIQFMVNFELYQCKDCNNRSRLAYISDFELDGVSESDEIKEKIRSVSESVNAEMRTRGRDILKSGSMHDCRFELCDQNSSNTGTFSISYRQGKSIDHYSVWESMLQKGIIYFHKTQLQPLDGMAIKIVNRIMERYKEDISLELQILNARIAQPARDDDLEKYAWKDFVFSVEDLPLHDQHLHQKTMFVTGWLASVALDWTENEKSLEGPFMADAEAKKVVDRLKDMRKQQSCITAVEDQFLPSNSPCEYDFLETVVKGFKKRLGVKKSQLTKGGPFKGSHHLIKNLPGTSNLRVLVPLEFASEYLDEIDQDFSYYYYPIKFNDKFRRCMGLAMIITYQKISADLEGNPDGSEMSNLSKIRRTAGEKSMDKKTGKKIRYLDHLKKRRASIIQDRKSGIDPALLVEMNDYISRLSNGLKFWQFAEEERKRMFEIAELHPAFAMDAELAQARYLTSHSKFYNTHTDMAPSTSDRNAFMRILEEISAADDYSYMLTGTYRGEMEKGIHKVIQIRIGDPEWYKTAGNIMKVIGTVTVPNMYVFLLLENREVIIYIGHYSLTLENTVIPAMFSEMHMGRGVLYFAFTESEIYSEDIDAEYGVVTPEDFMKLRQRIKEGQGREYSESVHIS